jgi:hypothetical protein
MQIGFTLMENASQEVVISLGNDSRKAHKFIENIEKGKTRKVTQE